MTYIALALNERMNPEKPLKPVNCTKCGAKFFVPDAPG